MKKKLRSSSETKLSLATPHSQAPPSSSTGAQRFKTHAIYSTWSPLVSKSSAQQMFRERQALISHWFDLWNDKQRNELLDMLLTKSRKSQLLFLNDWFQDQVPILHLDFTQVLPKFLSLYIFSFLDPRNLSRTCQVSSHWKSLTEDDVLWKPKCLRHGWHLPYIPSDIEHGAWKRHYIACFRTLDVISPSQAGELFASFSKREHTDSGFILEQPSKVVSVSTRRDRTFRSEAIGKPGFSLSVDRKVWRGPDHHPRELESTDPAVYRKHQDDIAPDVLANSLVCHERWGLSVPKKSMRRSRSEDGVGVVKHFPYSNFPRQYKTFQFDENWDLVGGAAKDRLTGLLEIKNAYERRLTGIISNDPDRAVRALIRGSDTHKQRSFFQPESRHVYPYSATIKTTGPFALSPVSLTAHTNPRIVFISSKVIAAEVLHNSVLFGALPILYEYGGTTLEVLLSRMKTMLSGRYASSVAFLVHSDPLRPGTLQLIRNCHVTLDTLGDDKVMEFFQSIAAHTLPLGSGGRVDFFAPICSSETGLEMLTQLRIMTGIPFSSPTGKISHHDFVDTNWLVPADEGSPANLYFELSKLRTWASTCNHVQQAIEVAKSSIEPFFKRFQYQLVSHIIGDLIQDSVNCLMVHERNELGRLLTDSLINVHKSGSDITDKVKYIGEFITQRHASPASEELNSDIKPPNVTDVNKNDDDDYQPVPSPRHNVSSRLSQRQLSIDTPITPEPIYCDRSPIPRPESSGYASDSRPLPSYSRESRLSLNMSVGAAGISEDGFQQRICPDRRTMVAKEILVSERTYVGCLDIIRDVFVVPLQAALASNRAIISAANVHQIFAPILLIREVNRELLHDLEQRWADWSSYQCTGDVLLRFAGKLKLYSNFANNYSVLLATIDRTVETTPAFRAFLMRQERTLSTRMMTLCELLLSICERFADYVQLLVWFLSNTPPDHNDRPNLVEALRVMKEMHLFMQQTKKRYDQDQELCGLQKDIQGCPVLLESNRYFVTRIDASVLKPPADDIRPELRVYHCVDSVGLILFNDSVIICKRVQRHRPFQRAADVYYKYESCWPLHFVSVGNLPDSKLLKHGFELFLGENDELTLCTENEEQKLNFLSCLETELSIWSQSL